MTERSKKYLSDLLRAIALIEEFIEGIDDFNIYERDLKTQSAIERQLVIIGKALNQIQKLEPTLFIKYDRRIIGFRNRLVHAYNDIDNAIVWAILHRHLTPLKQKVEALLF